MGVRSKVAPVSQKGTLELGPEAPAHAGQVEKRSAKTGHSGQDDSDHRTKKRAGVAKLPLRRRRAGFYDEMPSPK